MRVQFLGMQLQSSKDGLYESPGEVIYFLESLTHRLIFRC